jgi:uncharacterized protein YndB with AHSA1/START domain
MIESNLKVEQKDKQLILSRVFQASIETAFKAYSSCEHLKHWWGPKTWPMEECEMDFRAGGTWKYCLRGPNEGDESWGKSVFEEIEQPDKIVYMDYFADKDGNVNQQMPSLHITVLFLPEENGTRITVRVDMESKMELEKLVEMGMVEGMNESWDRLEFFFNESTENEA